MGGFKRSALAYHVGWKTWFQLPNLPHDRFYSIVSVIGNQYILLAGGHGFVNDTSSVIALDWTKKEWYELPSLPGLRSCGTGVFVPSPTNKWIIIGGSRNNEPAYMSFSLEVAPGIGWAKEKQLLLAFRGKAKRKGSKRICSLEEFPSGVFANILSYLIIPFPHEVNCKGSIFA